MEPIAGSDVGDMLARVAAAPHKNRPATWPDLGNQDLVDKARRHLTARGDDTTGEALLPSGDAPTGPIPFDDSLEANIGHSADRPTEATQGRW